MVNHWAPFIVELVSTPNTQVSEIDQLADLKRGLPNVPVVPLLPSNCSGQQPLMSILKCYLESGLMLCHPILYFPWLRVPDSAQ